MPAKKKPTGRVTPKGTQSTPPKADKPIAHEHFARARSSKPPRIETHSAPRSGHRGNR